MNRIDEPPKPLNRQVPESASRQPESLKHSPNYSLVLADLALMLKKREKVDLDYVPDPIFTDQIELDVAPYDGNIQSPTPFDPDGIVINGAPYMLHAESWMMKRFNNGLIRSGDAGIELPFDTLTAVQDEIISQHHIRCEQNQNAYGRLMRVVAQDPDRFCDEHRTALWAIRSAIAGPHSRAQLLFDFPEIKGIEDMKDTAVFDLEGYGRRRKQYISRLFSMNIVDGWRVVLRNDGDHNYQFKSVDPRGIVLVKGVIADIYNEKDQVIEVVERRSYSLLPASLSSGGKFDNMVRGIDGQLYNQQLIAGSVYFRTAESVLQDDDPEDMSSMLVVDNPLGVGPTLS